MLNRESNTTAKCGAYYNAALDLSEEVRVSVCV